jgi:hypothetical protein
MRLFLTVVFLGFSAFAFASPQSGPQSDDDVIQEIQNTHKQMAEQAKAADPAQWIDSFLHDASLSGRQKKLISVINSDKFKRDANSIAANPNKAWLYGGLIAVWILYMILSRLFLAPFKKFFIRFLLRIIMRIAYLCASAFVVYLILGQPVVDIVIAIEKAAFS